MACLTGLVAQVAFRLPWISVPITGQTFAVLLSSVLLRAKWNGLSQIIYAVLGFAGIPWFAEWSEGIAVLFSLSSGIRFYFSCFFYLLFY